MTISKDTKVRLRWEHEIVGVVLQASVFPDGNLRIKYGDVEVIAPASWFERVPEPEAVPSDLAILQAVLGSAAPAGMGHATKSEMFLIERVRDLFKAAPPSAKPEERCADCAERCENQQCNLYPDKSIYHDGCDGQFCSHGYCQECGSVLSDDPVPAAKPEVPADLSLVCAKCGETYHRFIGCDDIPHDCKPKPEVPVEVVLEIVKYRWGLRFYRDLMVWIAERGYAAGDKCIVCLHAKEVHLSAFRACSATGCGCGRFATAAPAQKEKM